MSSQLSRAHTTVDENRPIREVGSIQTVFYDRLRWNRNLELGQSSWNSSRLRPEFVRGWSLRVCVVKLRCPVFCFFFFLCVCVCVGRNESTLLWGWRRGGVMQHAKGLLAQSDKINIHSCFFLFLFFLGQ